MLMWNWFYLANPPIMMFVVGGGGGGGRGLEPGVILYTSQWKKKSSLDVGLAGSVGSSIFYP